MFRRHALVLAAGAALAAVGFVTPSAVRAADPAPAGAEPTTQQLLEQIKQLQSKVEQLEAKQKDQQAQNSADVAKTVDQIYKDAAKRSTLFGETEPFSSNWTAGRFVLRSDDGNFVLRPWLQFQVRGTANYRDQPTGTDTNNWNDGFEVRRMKFGVDGNAFSPNITYLFNWATDRNTGTPLLEEAWVRAKLNDTWSVRGGQIKDPLAHESIMSSKKFVAVERTVLTDTFTGGDNFVQGVAAAYSHDALQFEVALTDGINSPNQNFQNFPTTNWDFGVAGRIQYKVFGDWASYEQFSSLGNKHDLLVVGGGLDWSEGGDTDLVTETADVQYNLTNGLGLFGAVYGRYTQNGPKGAGATSPATTNDTFDWGIIAQAAYLIPNTKWEPYARYSFIRFDSDSVPAGAGTDVNETSLGASYYVHGHDAKFTFDVTYLPGGWPVTDTSSDVLSSNGDEILFRGQFQLLL